MAISRRPGRSLLTALGTAVGVGAFVATVGLASTANAQIGSRFDAIEATTVEVAFAEPDGANRFATDVDNRLERLNGVRAAGQFSTLPTESLRPRALLEAQGANASEVALMAASPGALGASRPSLRSGRVFDAWHDQRGERVALLGANAAATLGVRGSNGWPAIFLGDDAYVVMGIIDDVVRMPELLNAIIIPSGTARMNFTGTPTDEWVLIEVDPGAADLIGGQAALALRPEDPSVLRVAVPVDPQQFRESIEEDVASLLFGLAGVALIVGMVGIANTTLVSVLERRAEIGVRRTLGARRIHIGTQFLAESAVLGGLGGVFGTSIGILAVATVSALRQWTTTIEPLLPLVAPFIGVVAGLLAGLYPALRAAGTQPAAALRT